MPELPEVETVRIGLSAFAIGRRIESVDVLHPRAVRRDPEGAAGLAARLVGRQFRCASRRGKYLWLPLDDDCHALVAHLGMSGQLLMVDPGAAAERHLRVRIAFADRGADLRFVDQRTFGGLAIDALVDDGAGGRVPSTVAHIERDPLDPAFDDDAFVRDLRRRTSGVKRCLLDQTLASGVGNIYADESLWRARIHPEREACSLTSAQARELLAQARSVMSDALAQGGTSFDALYVNVNGESGWFDRSLDAYGQAGEPCSRCGTTIVREPFMNRSSYRCPRCQRTPRSRLQGEPAGR